MTLEEVRSKITISENADWFNTQSIVISNPITQLNVSITGIGAIYSLILEQIEGFSSITQLPRCFNSVPGQLEGIKNDLVQIVNKEIVDEPVWNTIKKRCQAIRFLFNDPYTQFLIKLNDKDPSFASAAYEFATKPELASTTNRTSLTGYFLAYQFLNTEQEITTSVINEVESSLSELRNKFRENLLETELALSKHLKESKNKLDASSLEIDALLKERKGQYDQWFLQVGGEFESFDKGNHKKIADLEELYIQKLKLEAPAKYWNDRAKRLRTEGYWWLAGLVLNIAVGIGILVWILAMIAEGTLTHIFSTTATAIKWSVAFITLISFIAYAMRTIAKLTFSSFHLVRDAEEREQLTYVYLSLQKEKVIDQTERHLIMQSLFSRADSGLLKDDASPTMPGNILDKALLR